MTWLQIHYSQVLALSAIVQTAATIVLVLVTFAYVLFTRSLAQKAQLQATAAQAQADAARDAIDRAYEDGVRQQAQLVQRQAILGARSELASQLSMSLSWLLRTLAATRSLTREDDYGYLEDSEDHLLRLHADRIGEVEAADGACELSYLEDFAGAFPLSESLMEDLSVAGHLVTSSLGTVGTKLTLARAGIPQESTAFQEAADALLSMGMDLARAIETLRQVVRTSGYARAFGTLALDSADTATKTWMIVERNGSWYLGESLKTTLFAPNGV